MYFQNGAHLYRYDRGSPPENQHPVGTALPGELAGVIGDNAAILSDASRLTVAVRTARGYVQHDYDLSAQMPKTAFTFNGHVFSQGGVVTLASDPNRLCQRGCRVLRRSRTGRRAGAPLTARREQGAPHNVG